MDLFIGILIGLIMAALIVPMLLRAAAEAEPPCEHDWKITRKEDRFSFWPSSFYYKQSHPCRVWSTCSKCKKTKVEDFN